MGLDSPGSGGDAWSVAARTPICVYHSCKQLLLVIKLHTFVNCCERELNEVGIVWTDGGRDP